MEFTREETKRIKPHAFNAMENWHVFNYAYLELFHDFMTDDWPFYFLFFYTFNPMSRAVDYFSYLKSRK